MTRWRIPRAGRRDDNGGLPATLPVFPLDQPPDFDGQTPAESFLRMPFSSFGLHPDILKGVREMGFTRPTPIQADAIPPGLAGRDVLACAATGSGKTRRVPAADPSRLLGEAARRDARPDPHAHARARRADRGAPAPARGPHAVSGAAVFGGVGMGPQEHAFRTRRRRHRRDPGRLLDHFRYPTRGSTGLEVLVLDEADRMLDMGFLPDIRRVLKHLPAEAADALLLRDDAAADRRR